MSIEQLLTDPCTIITVTEGPETDEYNNPLEVTTETDALSYWEPLAGGASAFSSGESDVLQQVQTEEWSVIFPAGTVVDGAARLRRATGVVFEVVGPPSDWWNPRIRAFHHVQLRVRRTGGPIDEGGS